MSILARIQWHDRPYDGIAHYLSDARASFAAWATDGAQAELPDGEHTVALTDRQRTVRIRSPHGSVPGDDADLTSFEGIVWDTMAGAVGTTTRWEVVVRAVGNDERVDVVVENRMETSAPTRAAAHRAAACRRRPARDPGGAEPGDVAAPVRARGHTRHRHPAPGR